MAIAPNGRPYVAFTEKSVCTRGPDLAPYLVVASRSGPTGKWVARRVTRPAVRFGFDDKPSLTVGRDGRVYVAWSRLLGRAYQTTVLSSSADGGHSWSPPRPVSRELEQPQLVSLIACAGRARCTSRVSTRSTASGLAARPTREVASRSSRRLPLPCNQAATCIVFGDYLIPQQAVRCLGPNPTVSVAKDRGTSPTQRRGRTGRKTSPSPSSTRRCAPSSGVLSGRPTRRSPVSSGPSPQPMREAAMSGLASTTRAATTSGNTRGSRAACRSTGGAGRRPLWIDTRGLAGDGEDLRRSPLAQAVRAD
ncbi:hypothetical protein BH18ACT12_BH18ACT12_23250 [soil metagenome]